MVYKKKACGSKTRKRTVSKKVATKTYVKRVLASNEETKFSYTDGQLLPVDSSPGVIFDMTSIAQGTDAYSRIGNKIAPVSLRVRFSAIRADTYNRMRVICIQWKSNDNVDLPQLSEILNIGPASETVLSPYNDQLRSQFTVLKDYVLTLDGIENNVITSGFTVYPKQKVEYISGTTNKGRRHIYLIFTSDSGATPYPLIDYSTTLKFKDA